MEQNLKFVKADRLSLVASARQYAAKVNWRVFLLICLYTMGSWIDTYGIWSQLPILTSELAEKWALSSILTITTQMGQVGPVVFLVGHFLFPRQFSFANVSYVILGVGALSCLLLAFFWKSTAFVFGKERSIGVYILNFFLSLLDGTSSLVFLPYIGANFIKEYIIANYIGESLSAFVPGMLALLQNVNHVEPHNQCANSTIGLQNDTSSIAPQGVNPRPLFSVSVFFFIMSALLAISTFAFYALNNTDFGRRERQRVKELRSKSSSSTNSAANQNNEDDELISKKELVVEAQVRRARLGGAEGREMVILLGMVFVSTFIGYGVAPGLQTFSVLPYGTRSFNLAVNLSLVLLPISIFLTIWSYNVSVLRIVLEFTITLIVSFYVIAMACMSPCPLFKGKWYGSAFIVVAWVANQLMFMRVRCLIATRLERFGKKALLANGTLTMLGQMIGASVVFVVVNVYELLQEQPPCSPDICS